MRNDFLNNFAMQKISKFDLVHTFSIVIVYANFIDPMAATFDRDTWCHMQKSEIENCNFAKMFKIMISLKFATCQNYMFYSI